MKVQFNFEKKHFYIFLVVFAVFAGVIYVKGLASSVPPTPWHPLQEVATGSSGTSSVDTNANGAIDNADNAQDAQNALGIQGKSVYWSSNSLCFDQSAVCLAPQSTSCTAAAATNTVVFGADNCGDADCPTVCRGKVACNGDVYSQCGGGFAGTNSYYQTGVCTGCSAGKCFCDCSNPQSTYLREQLQAPTTNCATFS